MPLRLTEIVIPEKHGAELDGLLEKIDKIGIWHDTIGDRLLLVRVFLESAQSDALIDLVSGRFEDVDGFRLMLLDVEATLPHIEEPRPDAAAPGEGGAHETAKPDPLRLSREELYEDIGRGVGLRSAYVVTLILSALVAAIGLVRGELAVIIGAMVIAPLLGPVIALAFSTTLGDTALLSRSLRVLGVSLLVALAVSAAIGFLFPVDPSMHEVFARSRVGVSDIMLALAAGSAGALAFTSGVAATLVGVMVAVALLPPLVATGLLAGSGWFRPAFGAFVLFLTNIISINLASIVTFWIQRIRPRLWWDEQKALKATRISTILLLILLGLLAVVILLVLSRDTPPGFSDIR
jgi:uncharacterized hydrophobic protein (TIGR00341 family)